MMENLAWNRSAAAEMRTFKTVGENAAKKGIRSYSAEVETLEIGLEHGVVVFSVVRSL